MGRGEDAGACATPLCRRTVCHPHLLPQRLERGRGEGKQRVRTDLALASFGAEIGVYSHHCPQSQTLRLRHEHLVLCLAGTAPGSAGTGSCRAIALGALSPRTGQHTAGHAFPVLWLSWCNSAPHDMSVFKPFSVFPPFLFVLSLFRRNLD